MGLPASPVVADIVMETLLDNRMEKLRQPQRLLTKYVDDLFAIIKEDEIENSIAILNSFDKSIKIYDGTGIGGPTVIFGLNSA